MKAKETDRECQEKTAGVPLQGEGHNARKVARTFLLVRGSSAALRGTAVAAHGNKLLRPDSTPPCAAAASYYALRQPPSSGTAGAAGTDTSSLLVLRLPQCGGPPPAGRAPWIHFLARRWQTPRTANPGRDKGGPYTSKSPLDGLGQACPSFT
jgi:hypothetical protein